MTIGLGDTSSVEIGPGDPGPDHIGPDTIDSDSVRPGGKLATLCVHAGGGPEPVTGAINPPVFLSTTFVQDGPGQHRGYHYARAGNPTRTVVERALADLEGARHGFAFASGCAATTTVLLTLRSGDHVIVGKDIYSGTFRLLRNVFCDFAIEATFVDLRDPGELDRAIRPATRMIWMETPSNPLLEVADLSAIGEVAQRRSLVLVVDNTFATPILQRPLEYGATLVVHSTTKYLNGHCDVLGGAVLTDDNALAQRLELLQKAVGAVPSPLDSYLLLRGLKTLAVRIRQQVENARILARWLEGFSDIVRVHYPGLSSHPDHELAARQMKGPGAIISVELAGGFAAARSFLQAMRLFSCAISLGGAESLAEHPASMTHAAVPQAVRRAVGISDGLVRLSIGLEDIDDLRADVECALAATRCHNPPSVQRPGLAKEVSGE
ncbi:MAG: PLP-dependent aspartate aminotransferase family protein [Proteobacteria bacterium]|nr:PLP-dependent aspartate aminotransferase family protein [Pseudomonadota bacterium]